MSEIQNGAETVAKWLGEIDSASKAENDWREKSKKIVGLYRDDKRTNGQRFNILYANVEVLKGVMYARLPQPDIRRRYNDQDPVGRAASEVLTRAISYSMDAYNFDGVMRSSVLDVLLPGRACARVRYVPHISTETQYRPAQPMSYDEDGEPVYAQEAVEQQGQMMMPEPVDTVTYEEVRCDYIDWRFVRFSPCSRWEQMRWIAFGELLTREELIDQFGDTGKLVKLDYQDKDTESDEGKRALVWMVWNKLDRKVYVISGGYPNAPIAVSDDPLKLEQFFPIPKPLASIWTNETITPVPDYVQYQDQAKELDRVTARINALVEALKFRGIYDGSQPELAKLARADDNTMIPVENYAALVEKGGLKGSVDMLDVSGIAKIVLDLYQQREQIISVIYQITGISDIVRGATDPNETASAQTLKAQYGNSRISPRQQAVQVFARDLIRLMAEIIAEHFSAETLASISGLKLPDAQAKQQALMQAQQQATQDPQAGQQAMQQAQQMVTWDDVMGLLRNEKLRGFRIDIETDSTIAADDQAEKANVSEMLQSVSMLVKEFYPAVQQGAISFDAFKAILLFALRRFRCSKEIEEQIENLQAPPPPQPDPNEQAKAQAEVQKAQLDVEGKQIDLEKSKTELQGQKVETLGADTLVGLMGQLHDMVQQIGQTISAPKRIVRDQNGIVIGVGQGDMIQKVVRGEDGKIAGVMP